MAIAEGLRQAGGGRLCVRGRSAFGGIVLVGKKRDFLGVGHDGGDLVSQLTGELVFFG